MDRTDQAQKGTGGPHRCGNGRRAISVREPRRRAVRSRFGGARALLLAGIALAAALGTYWLLGDSLGGGSRRSDDVAVTRIPAAGSDGAPTESLASAPGDGPRIVGGIQAGPAGDYTRYEKVFDGTGTITGEVLVAQGVPYPETWSVILEPSRLGQGRDRATTQIVEGLPGQRDFELRDLPMGGYRIRAEAEGLASMAQEIVLYRLEGTGSAVDAVNATLKLTPIAAVDGSLRRANGDVADALDVYLVNRLDRNGGRYETTTDGAGFFRFEGVRRGAWAVHVGNPVRPLTEAVAVDVELASIELEPIDLPELCTMRVLVVDEWGRPFPDVDVVANLRGTGTGSFAERTDGIGELTVDYLAPGPWRIEATYAAEGQSGRLDVALSPEDAQTVHEVLIR